MQGYYKNRAAYYDRVYSYPERQQDLRYLENLIPDQFSGRDVLEVAAGTGYWTQFIAQKARRILATDLLDEQLAQIRNRPLACPVELKIQDAFKLSALGEKYSGIFSALWISHIPKQKLSTFFDQLHSCARQDCRIVLIDNSKAQCLRLPISFQDEYGNTYQDRSLDDGSVHRVLKNFPDEDELIASVGPRATAISYTSLEHFWLFQYSLD
jgi:demethylmenaquinone methyltransferase/2-methoxy-6-polyprenyl-1,4-benzoquinol methylase